LVNQIASQYWVSGGAEAPIAAPWGGRNSSGGNTAFEVDQINVLVSMANPKDRVCAVLLTFHSSN
jgi:hypothetical protein